MGLYLPHHLECNAIQLSVCLDVECLVNAKEMDMNALLPTFNGIISYHPSMIYQVNSIRGKLNGIKFIEDLSNV
jgi:hypothetical protein